MNSIKEKIFYPATAMLIGTTIGVGIFGLPYAIMKTGVAIGLVEILILGFMVVLIHLFYAEIIVRTKERHRLVGYAEQYLGKKGKYVATLSIFFGYSGSLLAYMVVGGMFLNELLGAWIPIGAYGFSLLLFFVGELFIYFGLKLVAKGELVMTGLLLFTILIIVLRSIPHVQSENLLTIDFSQSFTPYGVILFALGASSAIPELIGLLSKNRYLVKSSVITGTLVPALVYIVFVFMVIGVTGRDTTQEAIQGLDIVFGDGIMALGMMFGFLAVVTSFLVIGLNFKEIFWYDYKLPHSLAWAVAMGIPLVLFLVGTNDFITIISLVGGISGGVDGVLLVLLYWKAKEYGDRKPEFALKVPTWLGAVVASAFFLGAVYEVVFQLFID